MKPLTYIRSSLVARLVISIIISVIIGVAMLTLSNARGISRFSQRGNDGMLSAVARATADSLTARDGKVVVNPPLTSLSVLRGSNNAAHYSVRVGDRIVSGTPDLPIVPIPASATNRSNLEYLDYEGRQFRIAAVERRMAGISQPVVVQIAQTLEVPANLRYWMVTSTLFNGALLILVLIVLLILSMRWWLAPWSELRRQIENRDVDDLRPLQMRNVPAEMSSLLEAFNDLLLRLRRSMEEIRRFTSNASHQMRTPLSILSAHLDIIRREGLDSAKGQASFADVEAAVGRLQRLLTQLLALARAEDASEEVAGLFQRTDLVAVARDVAEQMVPPALAAGVELEFDARQPVIHIETVEMLAHELVSNLLDNAIRYNGKGGSVRVILEQKDQSASVIVEDDGPGIPEEERARIFDRFRRLGRDQKQEGSGLGLAIVKSIADLIGASVDIATGSNGAGVRAEVRFQTVRPA